MFIQNMTTLILFRDGFDKFIQKFCVEFTRAKILAPIRQNCFRCPPSQPIILGCPERSSLVRPPSSGSQLFLAVMGRGHGVRTLTIGCQGKVWSCHSQLGDIIRCQFNSLDQFLVSGLYFVWGYVHEENDFFLGIELPVVHPNLFVVTLFVHISYCVYM